MIQINVHLTSSKHYCNILNPTLILGSNVNKNFQQFNKIYICDNIAYYYYKKFYWNYLRLAYYMLCWNNLCNNVNKFRLNCEPRGRWCVVIWVQVLSIIILSEASNLMTAHIFKLMTGHIFKLMIGHISI